MTYKSRTPFRMFADFTHADPRFRNEGDAPSAGNEINTNSISEFVRMQEEEAPDFGPLFDTVIFSEENTLVPANDGPTLVGFDVATDSGLAIVYGRFSDGTLQVFDEMDYIPYPANDFIDAIGLSGFAQTGKTAVANYIESRYGFVRQHIAEPLRDMLRTLLRRFRMDEALIDRYLTGDLKEDVIPCLGVTSRHAQITIGTEWGRELIDQDLWARLWAVEAYGAEETKRMNDSVRFRNEEAAIQQELGGFTIMIERPGTGPVAFTGWKWLSRQLYKLGIMWGVHPSERVDLLDPDYVVVNDGTLEDLYEQIDGIMAQEGIVPCDF